MSTLTMTFVDDLGGGTTPRYRVGCLACGWRATAMLWRTARRANRVHQCILWQAQDERAPGSGREEG